MHAHEFAGLIGKNVTMFRPATEVEGLEHKAETGEALNQISRSGVVFQVVDSGTTHVGGWGVLIFFSGVKSVLVVQDDMPDWQISVSLV